MKSATRWALLAIVAICSAGHAQNKGEPGKFDFYLMDVPWPSAFCSVPGAGADCKTPKGFVLHGLWAQNFDGSYPVFCAERPGPAHPEANLDITPDPTLLKHEWDKHGTCTTLSPEAFFAAERKAYHSLAIPDVFKHIDRDAEMKPAEILDLFGKINPGFPPGSILLSCVNSRLTAVEACLSKDLKPIVCQGLRSCSANVVKIAPTTAR